MEVKMKQKLHLANLTDGSYGNEVSESDLKKINSMKANGPIRSLTAEQIFVRRMIILGTEVTSKMSIHPEGDCGGKKINTLSELARQMPGTPMMEGHRVDKAAWGRIFDSEVVHGEKGYAGPVLKIAYYFLKADNGEQRAARIDGGIDAEGSISYWHGKACCSICHTELMIGSFFGMTMTRTKCNHQLGKSYDGVVCYWYPTNLKPAEVSMVFRGAYPKTKSMLTAEKFPKTEEELCAAYADAEDQTERFEMALADAVIAEQMKDPEPAPAASAPEAVLETVKPKNNDAEGSEGENGNSDDARSGTSTDGNRTSSDADPNTGNAELTGNSTTESGTSNVANLNTEVLAGNVNPEVHLGSVGLTEENVYNSGESTSNGNVDNSGITNVSCETENLSKEKYIVCDQCGYWEDNTGKKAGDQAKCPKCGSLMVPKNEKPKAPKKGGPCKVCFQCGYSVDAETAAELLITECHECGIPLSENCEKLPENYAEMLNIAENKIGSLVGPVKPAKSGQENNEFFTLEGFSTLQGEFMVEPKYDGVYIEAHKKNGQVTLLTDGNNHQEEKFPNVVAELEKLEADNFVLMGEMVKYRGRQRGTHSDVTAYMASKGPYEDYHFRFKPFDIAYAAGRDVRGKSKRERRTIQDDLIKASAHIHPTKFNIVSGGPKLLKAIEAMATREGAMVKNVEMTLNADGRKDIYKWKRQTEVDVRVVGIQQKSNGYVYECEVGNGKSQADEIEKIGQTYVTKVKAEKGNIIRVSVDKVTLDESTGKYSWYAPKVMEVREDKSEADPITVLKKIAEKKNAPPRSKNGMLLGDVLPLLEQHVHEYDLFVCGGLVTNGSSQHDVDILTTRELTAEEKQDILDVLGEDFGPYVDFLVNEKGPESTHVKIAAKSTVDLAAGKKYAKRFVLQRHEWGKKAHFDLRFGNPDGTKMWGWTLFKPMPVTENDPKVRCQEKMYHDIKWMDFEGEIKAGDPGNPTKNLKAKMTILDKGKYDFIERKPKFLEVVLHGDKYNGRYVFRQIEVSNSKNDMSELAAAGDEAKPKSDKIWIMWKPKDQTPGKQVNKIEFSIRDGVLFLWESDKVDTEF